MVSAPIHAQLRDSAAVLERLTDRGFTPTLAQTQNHAACLARLAEQVKRLEVFADEVVADHQEDNALSHQQAAALAAARQDAILAGKVIELRHHRIARAPSPMFGGVA